MGKILQTPALSVFEQMALDEVLARAPLAEPLLRFYRWTPGPAVTFGYAQFYDFVRRGVPAQAGPLCRRPTGGGLVQTSRGCRLRPPKRRAMAKR